MAASTDSPSSDEKRHGSTDTTNKDAAGKSAMWNKLKGIVWPEWAQEGVKSKRAWKTFVRCMIAVLCTTVLLVDDNSLQFMGQAGFFGLIVSVILPPSMALSIFLFAMLTLIVGLCFGWAWGVAAMAAGLRARDQVLLQQQIATTQAGFDPNANIDAQYRVAVFRGNFLDPKTSTVFGVFLFVGSYMLGFLRAHKPRLTLLCVFGSIIMDLMCSYGPLFPNAQYTLARLLLIPTSFYIAISIGCTIFIFPQSLSHIVITDLLKTNLKPIQSILRLQDDVLAAAPSDAARISELAGRAKGLRAAHVQGVNDLEGQIPMLQLEITRSQIGAGDLTKVFEKAKEVGSRSYGLASFVMLLNESNQSISQVAEENSSHTNMRVKKHFDTMKKDRHPGTHLDELVPIIASSTAELRQAAATALDGAVTWIDTVNHSRWSKPPPNAADITVRETNLAGLKETLAEYRATKHFELLDPYRQLFDEAGNVRPESHAAVRASAPTIFRCNVFTSSLISFSLMLIELLELLLSIERANPKAKIQLPSAFAKMLVKAANDTSAGGNPLDLGNGQNVDKDNSASSTDTLVAGQKEKKRKSTKAYARDPDAQDPTNLFQRFGRKVARLWKGLTSPEGLFAFKYGIVSIALWVPQVIPSSAYFVYHNRGLWALIMAQTGLGIFAGEQIILFLIRITGTTVGLVVGMVVWYIGAPGTQKGNPYGVTAALLVFLAPFLFMRILAPMQSTPLWLMAGVTITFVVGYSWVDEHVYQLANQGSGAGLTGRRALLVIIGFTAAFLVMLIPRPETAKRIVRRNIAKNIAATSELYARVLSGVEEEAELDVEGGDGTSLGKLDIAARVDMIRKPFMKIMGRMQSIHTQMAFASVEPGLRGPWPKKKYGALVEAHGNLLGALALLASAYARLQPVWCRRLERSDHLHPAFVADCLSLFSLLHQSLLNGQPMPPTMPIFERFAYHSMKRGDALRREGLAWGSSSTRQGEGSPVVGTADVSGQSTAGSDGESENDIIGGLEAHEDDRALRLLDGPLTWQMCHDEQVSIFATAVVALTHVVNGLNEMQRIIIELVGVREMGQFERAQERWGRYETSV